MPEVSITPQIIARFRDIIIANECGGDPSVAVEFSDPDGVRSGKSGWSFGLCQFDLQNNSLATACLKACCFTPEEIFGLVRQTIDPKPLEAKLREHRTVIESFDAAQLRGCLENALRICDRFKIQLADDTALLAIADYDNQYHLSALNKPGYLVNYLTLLGRPATAADILTFKLDHTTYGQKCPGDCKRRHANVINSRG